MENEDLEWTEKPFCEAFTDLVAFGQLAQSQITEIQKRAVLKGMHERCIACLEALCNGLISHLPQPQYPDDLKNCMVRKLGTLEKFELLSKIRGKDVPPDLKKLIHSLIESRNERISHPKVRKFTCEISSKGGRKVVLNRDKDVVKVKDPVWIIKELVKFIDRFFIEIHQIPEIQIQQYVFDSAVLPGGSVGTFVHTNLFRLYSILKDEFGVSPLFLSFLNNVKLEGSIYLEQSVNVEKGLA